MQHQAISDQSSSLWNFHPKSGILYGKNSVNFRWGIPSLPSASLRLRIEVYAYSFTTILTLTLCHLVAYLASTYCVRRTFKLSTIEWCMYSLVAVGTFFAIMLSFVEVWQSSSTSKCMNSKRVNPASLILRPPGLNFFPPPSLNHIWELTTAAIRKWVKIRVCQRLVITIVLK